MSNPLNNEINENGVPKQVTPLPTESKANFIEMPEPKYQAPETYDPQKRTFINKPKVLLCPTCGQQVHEPVKQMQGHMSVYVNADTGKDYATMANNADSLEVQGVELIRKDLYLKAQAAKIVSAPVVEVPKAPIISV